MHPSLYVGRFADYPDTRRKNDELRFAIRMRYLVMNGMLRHFVFAESRHLYNVSKAEFTLLTSLS